MFFKKIPVKAWIISSIYIAIFLISYFRIFSNYESFFYDLRLKLRPAASMSSDVVIIEISDDTINNLGKWPLPRDFHASLVKVLAEQGVKAIVFDILFSEPTLYDDLFTESIKQAKNVYFPLAFHFDRTKTRGQVTLEGKTILSDVLDSFKPYLLGSGHINVYVDKDGKVRKIPPFIKYDNKFIPHLALRVALDCLGLNSKNVEFKKNSLVIDKRINIPLSESGSLLVNYPAKWKDSFTHLSYFQILKSYQDLKKQKTPSIDLSALKEKVCFVGLTATGTSDFGPVPTEEIYPMLGLGPSVFNSLIKNDFIKDVGSKGNTLINILIFSLSLIICFLNQPVRSFLLNIGLGSIYFLLATAIFIFFGIWIDIFLPFVIIALSYIGVTLSKFLSEIRKNELLEKELDIAKTIQKSFLPQDINEFQGIKINSFMQPAKFVAGDLYDVIVLDDKRLGVFIGDVSGKGVPASLIMAQTISLFRVFAKASKSPSEVLSKLNKELLATLGGRFVTALYCIIDISNLSLEVSSAGHSPIIFFDSKNNRVDEFLPDSGLPLGVLEDAEYECFMKKMNLQDRLFFYTDGITEARDKKGDEFGTKRLKDLLLTQDGEAIFDSIKSEIFSFTKGLSQFDDITLILLTIGKKFV